MNDRLAFLRAIRANPDDDTARLVFADWLDEHDDPLGAFIRVQIELDPIRYRIDNPRALELHKREEELLRTHGADWIGTDHLLTNPADFGPVCRRGLPDYACLSLDTFLKNGEALFNAHPTLREVALYGLANRCSDLTMSPLLGRLDTLEIADWLTEDDAISLSVSPHLDKIARFKLWLGGEPHFLHELTRQASTNWPREIELIQVCGGVGDWPESPNTYYDEADSVVYNANKRLGRAAVRVTRPFEQLFPIKGDTGRYICAGRLPDGSPALAAGSYQNWILVRFTEDGRVLNQTVQESSIHGGSYAEARAAFETAFEEWVNDELQLELGLIWVREFAVGDLSVTLWPENLNDWVTGGDPFSDGGNARGWLEYRNFAVNWGNDYYADWRGQIHSS
jgi:uncharacterized protein (TIGR02996 family)